MTIHNSGSQPFDLAFAPAYPPCARVTAATLDGRAATWKEAAESTDWHPQFVISAKPGDSTLLIRHRGIFGYSVPFLPPQLAQPSESLKIISEKWTGNNQTLELTVSGRAARDYRLDIVGGDRISHVEGATLQGARSILVRTTADYGHQTVTIFLK